jgi:sugar/nucleoside kinase (ribokinase family)
MISLPIDERPLAFMGFDGFIDTIARVSQGNGRVFSSMSEMGAFLCGRREKNCSLELSAGARRMGGNMPNCANALAKMGIRVACVGSIGEGSPAPVFRAMHPLCSLYPVAPPGECLALEFSDSKLFLADMKGPGSMTWEGVLAAVGKEKLVTIAGSADLLGIFNWGELPNAQKIWEGFSRDILPALDQKPRTAVFDLSDCSSRSVEDVHAALAVLSRFREYMHVVLSANDNELLSMARALGYAGRGLDRAGSVVFKSGAMDKLIHHSIAYARVFGNGRAEMVDGTRVDRPVLMTGGGDHFNAGLCLGLLAGFGGYDCAMLGNAVSRLYVSTGESPSLTDVMDELPGHNEPDFKEEQA